MLLNRTGLSGALAVLMLLLAVLPMWRPRWFRRCGLAFETRHWLHLLVLPMGVTLCWHHAHVLLFVVLCFGGWALDRACLFFLRTRRVEDVSFMRLNDGSVQMRWKNPRGVEFRAGEYVRIMVPSISRELHPFSVFRYTPEADQQTEDGKSKMRVSSFSALAHVSSAGKAFQKMLDRRSSLNESDGGEAASTSLTTLGESQGRATPSVSTTPVMADVMKGGGDVESGAVDSVREASPDTSGEGIERSVSTTAEAEVVDSVRETSPDTSGEGVEQPVSTTAEAEAVGLAPARAPDCLPRSAELRRHLRTSKEKVGTALRRVVRASKEAIEGALMSPLPLRQSHTRDDVPARFQGRARAREETAPLTTPLTAKDAREEGGASFSQVFISPAGDWTRALSDNIQRWSTNGTWVAPCWVQGPFLSPFGQAISHGRLVVVASGIGLSAAMPLIQQLGTCEREVYLIWMSRSLEQLAYHLPLLVECTACFVYYTGKDQISPGMQEVLSTLTHVKVYSGRPQLEKTIAWLVSKRSQEVRSVMKATLVPPANRSQGGSHMGRRGSHVGRRGSFIAPTALATGEERLELPAAEVINTVDSERVHSACRITLSTHEWCVLYCGAVPKIRETLKGACRDSKIHYAEESFNW